jgi:Alpha/beta hydrolase domain
VTRPTDDSKFNGTVIVEWDNVSGGQDVPTEWIIAHRELVRSGYVHVAVTVQKVGIDGGPALMAGMPLRKTDPVRYGPLNHPGDAFAFDIFSQAGAVVRGPNAQTVLGGLVAKRVIAAGESQSAIFLTTYVNSIDPIARVFDGFLVHSRFGTAAPLNAPSILGGGVQSQPAPYRKDLPVPVLTVLTETDVLGSRLGGYYDARVPDTNHLRVWEIAGAAHADNYVFGLGMRDSGSLTPADLAKGFAPTTATVAGALAKPANTGQQHHYVMQAAITSIDRWLRTGTAPSHGDRLEVTAGKPAVYALDANGLVKGGVRTPWVDAPTMRLAGNGNSGGPLAMLAGVAEPFDATTLDRLYPGGKKQYLERFQRSLDKSIRAGFILAADRQEILDVAAASYNGKQ